MRDDLPAGTVTFLFTDVEGSTKLLSGLGAERYAQALAEHRRILREAFRKHDGVEVDTQGDAFFFAFPTAPGALTAAGDALEELADTPISIRVGIHTGTPLLTDEGYVGHDVHKAARIAAAGHGGQVLLSATTAALVQPSDKVSQGVLVDLGEHRLKDLSAPERIYQLGDEELPPLKTLHQTNLPIPATPFLGREKELGEVAGLLAREDVRLLTLTGPGGSGKTRLGTQAAGALAERYPNGVWWVPLAPLRDPQLVLETASSALGAQNGLADHIADKRLLLLFDNFEHVLDAATGLSSLLEECPNLELLVTSREPLHLRGEQEYAVPPFAHEEAVGFFSARARAVDPEFQVDSAVAEICSRLDDLPLALELAAARVKALTPQQILERLESRLPLLTGGSRDAPERQRTLRATIEWSYELLSEKEQALFARLAVFRGGCTLDAAEDLCAADLDTLQSLVDKSLVRRRDGRYWMLETIREYAAERLADSGEQEELARRHAAHFLALAEEAEPHLPAHRTEWLERLDAEHDNLRGALDTLEALREGELAQRLAGALFRFWFVRGLLMEGRSRLETVLSLDDTPTAARARALAGASMLASDDAHAVRRAEESLALYREAGDRWGIALAQLMLSSAISENDLERARDLGEESAQGFRVTGDAHWELITNRHLGWAYIGLGERERGLALLEKTLRDARAVGNVRLEAVLLGSVASYAIEDGKLESAREMLEESHRLHGAFGDPFNNACDVFRFARLLVAHEEMETAAELAACAHARADEIGMNLRTWDPVFVDETLEAIRAHVGESAFADAWSRGESYSPDEAVERALKQLESPERDEARLVEP